MSKKEIKVVLELTDVASTEFTKLLLEINEKIKRNKLKNAS